MTRIDLLHEVRELRESLAESRAFTLAIGERLHAASQALGAAAARRGEAEFVARVAEYLALMESMDG